MALPKCSTILMRFQDIYALGEGCFVDLLFPVLGEVINVCNAECDKIGNRL